MKQIVDVVNFNADASCLSSKRWLEILEGGNSSTLVQWLNLYVDLHKKVVLGFPGATVADIVNHNPEAIELINGHPDIFEIMLRPFAHDIALLRIGKGFSMNFEYGRKAIYKEFKNVCNYFLPPEFMLTNEQVAFLKGEGVSGVFINPARFSEEVEGRIPTFPYMIQGLFGTSLNCVSFEGRLTGYYLHALHMFDCGKWNGGIVNARQGCLFSWRDGESSFFIPEGLERESYWLENEDGMIKRRHLGELRLNFIPSEQLEDRHYRYYPVHSFSAWMKEFRMLGFVNRIHKIEDSLDRLAGERVCMWLMVINSDILSAIEKESPVVHMKDAQSSHRVYDYTIQRSERGFEGEEYLALLEKTIETGEIAEYIETSQAPHMIKLRGRLEYLERLKGEFA